MYEPVDKSIVYSQWFAGIGVTLLLVHIGLIGGWASPSLARLAEPNSPIHLDPEQASWVASLVNFSRLFGGILGAILTSYQGSKRTILVTIFPIAVGWLFIVFADRVEWLYASRLTSGLGLGMSLAAFPLYIGEVSMPEIRGALISLAILGAPFGQVIASVCGSYLSINMAATIYLVLALLLMILFFWLPESPHHLVKKGKQEAAQKSIHWYRSGRGVRDELEAVEKFIASDGKKTFVQKLAEFRTPAIKRATFQIIALFSFMQICGLNIIMFFMENILIRAKFTLMEPSLVVIYVNVLSTVATGVSIFLIDRCGRKFLLVVSSVGTTASMIGLMIHFLKLDETNCQWLSMGSVLLFMIAYFLGLMPVPSAILSEIFPANIKSIASCIAIITGAVTSFVSTLTYMPLLELIGDAYVFLLYAILSAAVIPYTLICVRETKGKSLQQIQVELMQK